MSISTVSEIPLSKYKKARDLFAQKFIKRLEEAVPGMECIEMYKQYFKDLDPKQFIEHLKLLEQGKHCYPIIIPNYSATQVDIDRLVKIGLDLGIKFQQHITITDQKDPSVTFQTPKRVYVTENTIRRQIQTSENKISVPTDADVVDDSTGQVTGDSKGSALSNPEARFNLNKGLVSTTHEFFSPLGGNNSSYDLLEDGIIEKGMVTLEEIKTEERPGSVEMIDVMFRSAGIKANF